MKELFHKVVKDRQHEGEERKEGREERERKSERREKRMERGERKEESDEEGPLKISCMRRQSALKQWLLILMWK